MSPKQERLQQLTVTSLSMEGQQVPRPWRLWRLVQCHPSRKMSRLMLIFLEDGCLAFPLNTHTIVNWSCLRVSLAFRLGECGVVATERPWHPARHLSTRTLSSQSSTNPGHSHAHCADSVDVALLQPPNVDSPVYSTDRSCPAATVVLCT